MKDLKTIKSQLSERKEITSDDINAVKTYFEIKTNSDLSELINIQQSAISRYLNNNPLAKHDKEKFKYLLLIIELIEEIKRLEERANTGNNELSIQVKNLTKKVHQLEEAIKPLLPPQPDQKQP